MIVYVTLQGNRERAIELDCDRDFFEANRADFITRGGNLLLDIDYLRRDEIPLRGLTVSPEDDCFVEVSYRIP